MCYRSITNGERWVEFTRTTETPKISLAVARNPVVVLALQVASVPRRPQVIPSGDLMYIAFPSSQLGSNLCDRRPIGSGLALLA